MKKLITVFLIVHASLFAVEDGFKSLYNGKDFTGWKMNKKDGYIINKDGAIEVKSGANLYTEKEYDDYILRFDFKLDSGGNNGMGLRSKFNGGDVAYKYFELQILDDSAPKYSKLRPDQYHGSIYGIKPAIKGSLKPVGEWNTQEVYLKANHLKVTVNGKVITDQDLSTAKRHKKFGQGLARARGLICFAGHGPGVQFKNIRIKELEDDYSIPKTADNTPPEGFTALFDGKTFNNWQGLLAKPYDKPHKRAGLTGDKLKEAQAKADEHMKKHWSIKDGELLFDGKGHSLATVKKYGNFEMYCSWKIAKNGDSGIYIRGLPQIQIWDPGNMGAKKHGADKGSGGLWNNKKEGRWPLVVADKPIGEWNTFFIRMIHDQVTIYLNGKLIVNAAPLENLWEKGKPIPKMEQIELQCHGHPVWWKNIYIKELP